MKRFLGKFSLFVIFKKEKPTINIKKNIYSSKPIPKASNPKKERSMDVKKDIKKVRKNSFTVTPKIKDSPFILFSTLDSSIFNPKKIEL